MTAVIIPSNQNIAQMLEEIASLLEVQHANPHRVRAYRHAANHIRQSLDDVAELARWDNDKTLESLPGIGEHLARLIIEYVNTGKCRMLQRLQGEVTAEEIFEQLAGIGIELASRIVHELNLHSLEELEQALYDGRLGQVKGFGRKRLKLIRLELSRSLGRYGEKRETVNFVNNQNETPPVRMLLDIDQQYRQQAAKGNLRLIAPRRFNPNHIAWLPIMHSEKADWHFTVVFSNTSRAHELKKTRDWVVIYIEKNGIEDRATIVTETGGVLKGKRVIRGRERETKEFYESIGLV